MSGHRAMYVINGPWWLSGQSVQRRFTVEPAAAGAWRGAGVDPIIPWTVSPPHSRSAYVTFSTGPLPWIARDMRCGCANIRMEVGYEIGGLTGVPM